jgi:hypothetical protein
MAVNSASATVDVSKWPIEEFLNFLVTVGKLETARGVYSPAFDAVKQIYQNPELRKLFQDEMRLHNLSSQSSVGKFIEILKEDAQKEIKQNAITQLSSLKGGETIRIKKIPPAFDSSGLPNDQDDNDVNAIVIDDTIADDVEDFKYYKSIIDKQTPFQPKKQNRITITQKNGVYLVPASIWSKSPSFKAPNPLSVSRMLKLVLAAVGSTGTLAAETLVNSAPSSFFPPGAGAFPGAGTSGTQINVQPQLGVQSFPSMSSSVLPGMSQGISQGVTPAVLERALYALPAASQQNVFSRVEESASEILNGYQVVPSFSADPGAYAYSLSETNVAQPTEDIAGAGAALAPENASVAVAPGESSESAVVPETSAAAVPPRGRVGMSKRSSRSDAKKKAPKADTKADATKAVTETEAVPDAVSETAPEAAPDAVPEAVAKTVTEAVTEAPNAFTGNTANASRRAFRGAATEAANSVTGAVTTVAVAAAKAAVNDMAFGGPKSGADPSDDIQEEPDVLKVVAKSMAQRDSLFPSGSAQSAVKVLDAERRKQMMARSLEYARASKCVLTSLKGVRAKLVAILGALLETTKRAGPLELAAADVEGMTAIIEEMKKSVAAEDADIAKRDAWIAKMEGQSTEDAAISDALESVYRDMGILLYARTNYQRQLKRARISSVATAIGKASARLKFSSAALASLQEANGGHQRCSVQYESAVAELANSAWEIIKMCEKGSVAEKAWVHVEKIFRGEDAYALLVSQNSDTGFPAWPEQVAAYEVPKGHLGATVLEMCDSMDKSCTTDHLAPTEFPEVSSNSSASEAFWKQKLVQMVSGRGPLPPATRNISTASQAGQAGLKPYKVGSAIYKSLKDLIAGAGALDKENVCSILFQVLYALAAVHSEVGASLHLFKAADDLSRVKLFEGPPIEIRRSPAARNLVKGQTTLDEDIANYRTKYVDVSPAARIYAIVPDHAGGDTRVDWSIPTRSPWVQLDIDYSRITGGKPSDVSIDARNFLELVAGAAQKGVAATVPSQILTELKPRPTIWNVLASGPLAALRTAARNEVPDFVIRGEVG